VCVCRQENAHFSIAEVLIAAIEQMKWNQVIGPRCDTVDHDDCDSDEEIQQLKQRIRIRRRECLNEVGYSVPSCTFFRVKQPTYELRCARASSKAVFSQPF